MLSAEPNSRFILVGGYGTAADVERVWLTGALLIYRDRVRFTGWLSPDQVMQCYTDAHILVVPSWNEPFGMVTLEGMLHGLALAAAAPEITGKRGEAEFGADEGAWREPKVADALARRAH